MIVNRGDVHVRSVCAQGFAAALVVGKKFPTSQEAQDAHESRSDEDVVIVRERVVWTSIEFGKHLHGHVKL